MSRIVSFKTHWAKFKNGNGNGFSIPLIHRKYLCLNEPVPQQIIDILEDELNWRKDFSGLLYSEINARVNKKTLTLSFDSLPFALQPEWQVSYEYEMLYWKVYSGNYIGMVPVLDLYLITADENQLTMNMTELIRNVLVFKDYIRKAETMLKTQWYKEAKLYSFTEDLLYETNEQKEQPLYQTILDKPLLSTNNLYGLKNEFENLQKKINGAFPQSVMLVGPPSSGKTTLIQELLKQETIGKFQDIRTTNASKLIRGLINNFGWQSNLGKICKELSENNVLIYLGRWIEYFEIGQYEGNSVSVGEALQGHLDKSQFIVIAECTEEEFSNFEHRYANFSAIFNKIQLPQLNDDELEEIVIQSISELAAKRKKQLKKEAILDLFRLLKRFSPYSGFPGKPIQFLQRLLMVDDYNQEINRDQILQKFTEETGIPPSIIDSRISLEESEIEQFFLTRVFGQQQAIDSIINIILTIKANLSPAHKPIASMIFTGPTGVGKTEMVKAIAEYLFGDSQRMIRYDMSEYSSEESTLRLTGEIPSDHSLMTQIKSQPFSVVLFDEIEKAHPKIFDLLLQILDEGRLTGNNGELANFCSSIIILTSNLGGRESFKDHVGFSQAQSAGNYKYQDALTQFFRPELINRFDDIIVFQALDKEKRLPILQKEMRRIWQRNGFLSRKIEFHYSEQVENYLMEKSYDVRYGARDMKRVLHHELIIPTSAILSKYRVEQPIQLDIQIEQNQLIFSATGINETEVISKSQLDTLTDYRRKYYKILDSHAYNVLDDIVQEAFEYQKRSIIKNLTFEQRNIISRSQEIKPVLKQYCNIETEIVEAEKEQFLGFMEKRAKSYDISSWLKSFQTSCKKIYELFYEDTIAHMNLYGNRKLLAYFYDFYSAICTIMGYKVTSYLIIMLEEVKNKKIQYRYVPCLYESQITSYPRVVGIEFIIEGSCPYLYFCQDQNLKIFLHKEDSKTYYTYSDIFEERLPVESIPQKIHRLDYFEKLQKKLKKEDIIYFQYNINKDNYFQSDNSLSAKLNPTDWARFLEEQLFNNVDQTLMEKEGSI